MGAEAGGGTCRKSSGGSKASGLEFVDEARHLAAKVGFSDFTLCLRFGPVAVQCDVHMTQNLSYRPVKRRRIAFQQLTPSAPITIDKHARSHRAVKPFLDDIHQRSLSFR